MSLGKGLVVFGVAAAMAVGVFHVAMNRITKYGIAPGCVALDDSGEIDKAETVAFWNNTPLKPLLAEVATDEETKVLGTTSGDKWIEIDLSDQRLRAWQDGEVFLESLISSGLWNGTPVGSYRIWYKIMYTKMEGGIKGHRSYYYLPNVPFAMFFHGDYGIHGTYWHNNFGTPMSHGCVNAPTNVSEKLFFWSNPQLPPGKRSVRATADNPGTRVVIHE